MLLGKEIDSEAVSDERQRRKCVEGAILYESGRLGVNFQ